jgi:flagellar hook protein FlgE
MDVMNAALGGMQIAQSSFERSAQRIVGASTQLNQSNQQSQKPDTVELSTEAVNMITARNQVQASAQVFQAGDKMQKKLLDMMA